ncbi:MAG: tetratricopeptide repeat protein [Prevotella sp.]|nr:tetratricopeptide repeat protein [Prevotella sp.]
MKTWDISLAIAALGCKARCTVVSVLLLALWLTPGPAQAQLNTDRLLMIGRSALYYEDYVLSMQYFNQAISAKPYLYEPWFFRAVAKYYLDDYAGAERDCSEALQRNPYVVNIYELRGLTRIQQNKFGEAISDYNRALRYDPENRGLWHNRVLCHIQNKEYDAALAELDTMQGRWSQYARNYVMRADVYMQMKDTTQAIDALQRSLDIDPYDAQTWAARSIISLSREEWSEAEDQLDHAIHLQPKQAGYHINRALARFNRNNLRGAMADYDMALDLEPNNFLGHYNRGLLRAQVGDDNRAITDFDFVLRLEPNNILARFNRAMLLDKTGDLRAAIDDYTKVIDEFPNFWTGLEARAACYRRLGMTKKAEADEFVVYKARLYKHLYGTQPRLDPTQMRKRSDLDPDKYNQLVVEDEQEPEREYQNAYRGRVQDQKVEMDLMPMYGLSFERQHDELHSGIAFDKSVNELNERIHARTLYIVSSSPTLDDTRSTGYFQYIDSLTAGMSQTHNTQAATDMLFLRAVAYAVLQNNESAIEDLTTYLQIDSTSVPALWQRAVCQWRINRFLAQEDNKQQGGEGTHVDLRTANVLGDLNHALTLSPQNAYLLYNRGTLYAKRSNYNQAIDDFTAALQHESSLAEAYFNRGLCLIYTNRPEEGIADLSKAGELGIYTAYSIIKKQKQKVSNSKD